MDEVLITPPPPSSGEPAQERGHHHRMRNILIACGIFLLIALLCFLIWFIFFRFWVSTDDAYVNGNRVIINAQVEGPCTGFFADNNQYVEKGQLLVEIDRTNYEIAYQKALIELEYQCRRVKNLQEEVRMLEYDIQAQEKVAARAKYDLENRQALVGVLAVSKEDVEHNRISAGTEVDKLESLRAQLQGQTALLGEQPVNEHPWILSAMEGAKSAFADLTRCRIVAPIAGLVTLRYVQVGQYLVPSTELMSVVPYEQMWVDANYKESQLRYLRIGQPATITFDQFGSDVKFQGIVQGIQMGTGAAFSLLPAQNATGNWIKIVQRVPVRILLKTEEIRQHPLRIGLSSYVSVHIEDLDLPVLQTPNGYSFSQETDVTEIDFGPVNSAMEEIIQENLYGR